MLGHALPKPALLEEAEEIVRRNLVWDNHGCMPLRWHDQSFLPQLERYRASGVNVVSLNIGYGELGVEDHFRALAGFRSWLLAHPEDYTLVESVADIERARRDGKLAVTFDIEGAGGIDDQISLIRAYRDLGVRWMLLAYNRRNLVGDGVHDEGEPQGLSAFGREVVAEMERVGMVVCCSHTGRKTAMDVMSIARNPVIFSHSNPRAVWDHKRNLDDEIMIACAQTGGVIGITGVGAFLGQNDASSATFARHVDYAIGLVGADHVGLGLDYVFDRQELADALVSMRHTFPDDPAYRQVPDFVAPEQIVEIVAHLLDMGHVEADLAKVLGKNHLRIAEQVWPGLKEAGGGVQ